MIMKRKRKLNRRPFKWTEWLAQNALYVWLDRRGQRYIVPNCSIYGWEPDLISITKKGFVSEYEIKVTRADFRNDFKRKLNKHHLLKKRFGGKYSTIPNYFYYVVPLNLITEAEVPEYAGLIYLENNCVNQWIIKKAPRLHSHPIKQYLIDYINRGLGFRYWRSRTKLKRRW